MLWKVTRGDSLVHVVAKTWFLARQIGAVRFGCGPEELLVEPFREPGSR